MTNVDNETWLIDTGDEIIVAKSNSADKSQSAIDRLIYCLWVADYGMRNAGDLVTAKDVDEKFHTDGRRISIELGLPQTAKLFSLSIRAFERSYFDFFDDVCAELRQARSS